MPPKGRPQKKIQLTLEDVERVFLPKPKPKPKKVRGKKAAKYTESRFKDLSEKQRQKQILESLESGLEVGKKNEDYLQSIFPIKDKKFLDKLRKLHVKKATAGELPPVEILNIMPQEIIEDIVEVMPRRPGRRQIIETETILPPAADPDDPEVREPHRPIGQLRKFGRPKRQPPRRPAEPMEPEPRRRARQPQPQPRRPGEPMEPEPRRRARQPQPPAAMPFPELEFFVPDSPPPGSIGHRRLEELEELEELPAESEFIYPDELPAEAEFIYPDELPAEAEFIYPDEPRMEDYEREFRDMAREMHIPEAELRGIREPLRERQFFYDEIVRHFDDGLREQFMALSDKDKEKFIEKLIKKQDKEKKDYEQKEIDKLLLEFLRKQMEIEKEPGFFENVDEEVYLKPRVVRVSYETMTKSGQPKKRFKNARSTLEELNEMKKYFNVYIVRTWGEAPQALKNVAVKNKEIYEMLGKFLNIDMSKFGAIKINNITLIAENNRVIVS